MKQNVRTCELLLEIGTEEIPSSYLSLLGTTSNLSELTKGVLREALFDAAEATKVESFQTPCRIVVSVKDLPPFFEKQEEIFGPRKEMCYASSGGPTPTLEGFLRSKQATLEELAEEGGRVVIRRRKKEMTREALKQALPRLVRLLVFPKMMRWENGDFRFPRPVRWLVCLYDGKILPVMLGNLKADCKTYGIRPLRTPKKVRRFEDYVVFLRKEKILLEACADGEGERKRYIRRQLKSQLQKWGGFQESLNEALLEEITNLVEKPVLFSGHFDKKFLKLPKEILVASLSKYQRLFSVESRKGELLPCFVACANGSPSVTKVRKNYEHVLNARLEDANFFFEEDTKEPFPQKREKLKLLIYHRQLGTMYDKSERMKQLAIHFSKALHLDAKTLLRACELSKNDLVTEMVKEFPSLQGIVGSYYAKISGEAEEVARAIREHYLPKGDIFQEFLSKEAKSTELFPESFLGSALSFLDKLDHLVGCFYAGESPTGSSDPFGLRRAANALFWIALHQKWNFSLEEMIRLNFNLLGSDNASPKLHGFLQERLRTQFREKGYRADLVEAVVTAMDRPVQMNEKLSALKEMMARQPDDFLAAFKVVERTHNILKPMEPKEREGMGDVQPGLFQDEIEKSLWNIYNTNKESIKRLIGESAWAEVTAQYGGFFSEKLHQFFEKVLVNVEDSNVRRNRLAMMKEINELYTKPVADLSRLMMNVDQTNR